MTEEIKKSNAGRKSKARASDIESLISTAERAMLKFDATCCNKLDDLYAMQLECAYGVDRFKDASVTNRKSAVEALIKRGESYAIGEAELLRTNTPPEEDKLPVEEAKQVSGGDVVVESFEDKKKAWLASKAKEKEDKE